MIKQRIPIIILKIETNLLCRSVDTSIFKIRRPIKILLKIVCIPSISKRFIVSSATIQGQNILKKVATKLIKWTRPWKKSKRLLNKKTLLSRAGILDNEDVKVVVFNTGNNIPKNDLEKVWEKFYKVDKARTREYGGSGVGLSIVKAIMDSMNQKCGVETTFEETCT